MTTPEEFKPTPEEKMPTLARMIELVSGRAQPTPEEMALKKQPETDTQWVMGEVDACLTVFKAGGGDEWLKQAVESIESLEFKFFRYPLYDHIAEHVDPKARERFAKLCPPEMDMSARSANRRMTYVEMSADHLGNYYPGHTFTDFVFHDPKISQSMAYAFTNVYPGVPSEYSDTIDTALVDFIRGKMDAQGLTETIDNVLSSVKQDIATSQNDIRPYKALSAALQELKQRVQPELREELHQEIQRLRKVDLPHLPGFSSSARLGLG